MDHAPGFSVHDFAVAGPNSGDNAWLCNFTIGGPQWLSPVDMSSGIGGIECVPIHSDLSWTQILVRDGTVIGRILVKLLRIP